MPAAGDRPPRSLNDLFKWSVAQEERLREDDARLNNDAKPMSEERKKFLLDAFNALTIDEVGEMKKKLALLAKEDPALEGEEKTVEERLESLQYIVDLVETIDNAQDLCTVGGYPVISQVLWSRHASLRAEAAEVLATLVQNNPNTQVHVAERGGLQLLRTRLEDEKNIEAKRKILRALSALLRQNESLSGAFVKLNGLTQVKACMDAPDEPLQQKALFLANTIAYSENSRSDMLDWASDLLVLMQSESNGVREQASKLLLQIWAFAKPSAEAMTNAKEVFLRRQAVLAGLSAEDQSATEEEAEHLGDLLALCE